MKWCIHCKNIIFTYEAFFIQGLTLTLWPADEKQNCFDREGNQGDDGDVDVQWVKRAKTRVWCDAFGEKSDKLKSLTDCEPCLFLANRWGTNLLPKPSHNLFINLFIYRSTALALIALWTLSHWLHSDFWSHSEL